VLAAVCGVPYWDSYSVTTGVDQIRRCCRGIALLQRRIQQEGLGNDELAKRWRGEPIVVR
jgi:hypothetical protein